MKKHIKIAVILFFTFLSLLNSCNDKEGCGGTKKVSSEQNLYAKLYREETISTEIQQLEESYIAYDATVNEATWRRKEGVFVIMHICNFPTKAKQWLLDGDSISVLVSGTVHEPTTDHGASPMNRVFYDFVISDIKKE